MSLRYLSGVATLSLDQARCDGCARCLEVCPHDVFAPGEARGPVRIQDRDACMECGACQRNCPTRAVTVQAGVGCASALIRSRLRPRSSECGGLPCG
jgi:NAD-dependent dihydropyrimidine dehydrogenase PreA subunit